MCNDRKIQLLNEEIEHLKEQLEVERANNQDQIAAFEAERSEIEDELDSANNAITRYEETSVVLTCPSCYGTITRDVIDGLICERCRRLYELKEK